MLVQINYSYKHIVPSFPSLCKHFEHSRKKFNVLIRRLKRFLQTITILVHLITTQKIRITVERLIQTFTIFKLRQGASSTRLARRSVRMSKKCQKNVKKIKNL